MPKKSCIALLAFFLCLAMLAAACGKAPEEPPSQDPPPPVEEEEEEPVPVALKKVSPAMVIIDNNPRALPQSGLQHATIVYELLVEGGLTRLLALFDTLPEENLVIGPIRSLRPYFARQAVEHGGVVAHSGYSQATREQIRGLSLKHIVSGTYLYRDSSRKRPHNLYTDTEKLYTAAGYDGSYTEVTPEPPLLPPGYEDGRELKVEYSRSNIVSYTYDEDTQTYLRFINQEPHTDRDTDLQYAARRVILRPARHTAVPDSKLVDIDLTGEGDGYLYEEGRQYAIRWVQEEGRTNFYYTDGSPVDLSFGNTWIQVVR